MKLGPFTTLLYMARQDIPISLSEVLGGFRNKPLNLARPRWSLTVRLTKTSKTPARPWQGENPSDPGIRSEAGFLGVSDCYHIIHRFWRPEQHHHLERFVTHEYFIILTRPGPLLSLLEILTFLPECPPPYPRFPATPLLRLNRFSSASWFLLNGFC